MPEIGTINSIVTRAFGFKRTHGMAFTWTCDATGVVETHIAQPLVGALLTLKTKPGTPAPTDLYDITVEDNNAIDILGGKGADRSATVGQSVAVDFHVDAPNFVIKIANAGISKQGFFELVVRWG